MRILGIEWSSSERTIALGDWSPDGGMRILSMDQMPEGRDSRYFKSFQKLSDATGVLKKDIQAIVVGLGPGSYAGIRSAISVAYGWHLANDAKLFGISSAQVLARRAFEVTGQSNVHTLIDAQRDECYHAEFRLTDDGISELVNPLTIKGREQMASSFQAKACYVGEDVQRWFSDSMSGEMKFPSIFPDAASLLKEVSPIMDQQGRETLAPIYLRPTSFVKAPPARISLPEEKPNNS